MFLPFRVNDVVAEASASYEAGEAGNVAATLKEFARGKRFVEEARSNNFEILLTE